MARSRKSVPVEVKSFAATLHASGLYNSKHRAWTPAKVKYVRRLMRDPANRDVIEGRAKSVKVGRRSARQYRDTFVRKGEHVIVPVAPGERVYARKGEVFRQLPRGGSARVTRPGTEEARHGERYALIIHGNPAGFFADQAAANAYRRRVYLNVKRAGADPEADPGWQILPMRLDRYERLIEQQTQRRERRRAEHLANQRRNMARLRRAVRPFR